MKKHNTNKKLSYSKNKYRRSFFIVFLVLILSLSIVKLNHSYLSRKGTVLGEENSSENSEPKEQTEAQEKTEKVEKVEPTETHESAENPELKEAQEKKELKSTEAPEANETPELKETQEKEVEKIHREVEQKIERSQLKSIEVAPGKTNQQTGILKLEQTNGQTVEKQVPSSQTPVTTLQNVQLGNVLLSVNTNGTISLVNKGIRIETDHPVIINPQTKTVAIKTKDGLAIINMFPSQILPKLSPVDKPTTTQSVHLTNKNNQPIYSISGKQTRRFLGIFPVEALIKTDVSAKNGSVLSIKEPWYFRNLGFLYSI